jgi:hypothetical protein
MEPTRGRGAGQFLRAAEPEELTIKVYFFSVAFFNGGHRKIRLPQNLRILGNFSYEFFQMKFEFKKILDTK